jgi:AcrR family transcriptional regulator
MQNQKHLAAGGRVSIYKRPNSRFWQCQGSFKGQSLRTSTKTEKLDEARRFAERWFLANIEDGDLGKTSFASAEVQNYFQSPLPDRRSIILSAATELVAEAGFQNAQVNQIAERAGVASGTLYRYFHSRNTLLTEVVAHVAQHEVNVVAGVAMGPESSKELLRKCAWTFASRAIRGRQLGYAMVAEPVESEIEIERLKYRNKLMRTFQTIIDEGTRNGSFPKQDSEVSSACIVGSLFEALVGPLAKDVDQSEAQRLERVEKIVDFCVRGVGTNSRV